MPPAMADDRLTHEEVATAKGRRLTAMGLQAIENNPLTPGEVEMFEMFERERWPHERCRQYILDHLAPEAQIAAE